MLFQNGIEMLVKVWQSGNNVQEQSNLAGPQPQAERRTVTFHYTVTLHCNNPRLTAKKCSN